MEAIILAGGLGKRLRQTVPDLPKPMAPVGGRPFLEYLLDYWSAQGVNRFILSVGYKREIIEKHFSGGFHGSEITCAVEKQPRGTGGGLLLALDSLKRPDPFLIMNGDTFFNISLASMRDFHANRHAELTIALRMVDGNTRYAGVDIDDNGRITMFDNQARAAGRVLMNGGVYLANRDVFSGIATDPGIPVSIEEQIFPDLMKAGKGLYGYTSSARFIDIGIPEDYERAASILQGA
ncbi:MAG: nucleotidyltransferase family protein [Sulfuricaulis sp.]